MYKIEAIFRPERLNDVTTALREHGVEDFVFAEVGGHGSEHGPTACYRGVVYEIPFVHQMRVELSAAGDALQAVIDCITAAAFTGRPGDGKIFVMPLDEVIKIGADDHGAADSRAVGVSRLFSKVAASTANSW